jgi:hypothetical protein
MNIAQLLTAALKPLVWVGDELEKKAKTHIGIYTIIDGGDRFYARRNDGQGIEFESMFKAKIWCKKDYEIRMISFYEKTLFLDAKSIVTRYYMATAMQKHDDSSWTIYMEGSNEPFAGARGSEQDAWFKALIKILTIAHDETAGH